MKKATWFIFFLVLAVSCLDDPDCYQLNNNLIGITFRVMGSTTVDTVAFLGVDIDGSDSTFISEPDISYILATGVPLPLNYTRDETDITFRFLGGGVYAMKLGYQSRTQFVSEDCGSRYELSDLAVLAYDFDSARVVDSSPGKTASSNVEVFRCPVTDIVTMSFRDLYISGTTGTSKFASVPLVNITADYTGDSFYQNSRTATVYLPVDISKEQTSFVFHYQNGESKEITLNYRKTTEIRYKQCGSQTFIDSLTISDSYSFDSASLVVVSKKTKNVLLDPHETNVYLYECPQTNLAKINFRTRTSSTTSRTDTVLLKSVKADATELYTNISATSITVPVNPGASSTTFTIEYTNNPTEIITLNYTRRTATLFERCGPQTLFSDLTEGTDIENVTILATDSLQYPPVSNLEIYHN